MNSIAPIILALLLIPIFIFIFYWMVKENKRTSIKTMENILNEGISPLKCSKCSNDMEAGFTVASKGLLFRNKDSEFKAIAPERLVPNTANMSFGIRENLAWKCSDCNLITLDHNFLIKTK